MANADFEMRWIKDQFESWHLSHSTERQTGRNCVE